jgi:FkbM family methyltransferase
MHKVYFNYCRFLGFFKGIKIINQKNNIFELIKNQKRIIVKKKNFSFKKGFKKIRSEYKQLIEGIKYFDLIFSYAVENTVDLSSNFFINYLGCKIETNFLQIKEISFAINTYNKYYKLKKGDVVFDLGGYHGLYSILASKEVGGFGKVYCFEPDPNNFEICKKNIENNNLKNIILINKGICDHSGEISFFKRGQGSRIVDDNFKTNTRDSLCKISVTSLSDFIKEKDLKKIDFIKADIEGSEVELIKDYLEKILPLEIYPKMAIACYHYRKDLKSRTDKILIDLFKEKGLVCKVGNRDHLCCFV